MKKCNGCKLELSLDSYTKSPRNKGGLKTKCKKCRHKDSLKYTKEKLGILDHFVVYYIPSAHYVGITNQPKARLLWHKTNGKDIKNWRVLFCSEDRYEARIMENRYHDMGFEGLNINC
tara:strand:+ start:34 stop:387 length:354 start_codon:yes stop_codon:yes gene_type:complete